MPRVISQATGPWGRSAVFGKSEELIVDAEAEPLNSEDSLSIEEKNTSESSLTLRDIYTNLTHLQSSLFATILEDTATQLRILVECNNELRIIKTYSDMSYLISLKYSIKQPTNVDELHGIDPKNLGCNEYKINKLDYDRKFITEAILATYMDLCLNERFSSLEDTIKVILDREKYRASLTQDEAQNKLTRRDLKKQLRQQRNHIKSVIYDTDVKIDDLKSEVEDSVLNGECQSRYVNNWQRARTEQHIQTIHDKEVVYSETVEYYKQRTDHEQRVHMEIEMLINIGINETLQKVEEWMAKYDKDMEAIDLKIQIQKNDYQNIYDKRVNLEETIELHDKLMKDWIYFKDEREKARQYREKMTNSAIIVQAWWRGLLVRRQLGPYKVSKKKAGKKK